MIGLLDLCTLLALGLAQATDGIPLKSTDPAYELRLPPGFEEKTPAETPRRFTLSCGRETWAKVSAVVRDSTAVLQQKQSGPVAEDLLPHLSLPADAKWSFVPLTWKDFDIGKIEYTAVVDNLPVFGIATVLPLTKGTLTLLFYAPTPLEKECRDEFAKALPRVLKAPTHWHPPEYYQKVAFFERFAIGGLALMGLYPIAWLIFFRNSALRAHWLRTLWLAAAAVLLFLPMNSPGEMSMLCNLLVNGVLPMSLLLFAARRIKMGIEEG